MQLSVLSGIFFTALLSSCSGKIWEIDIPTSLQECYNQVRNANIDTFVGSTYSWFCETAIKKSQMEGPATFDAQKMSYYSHLYDKSVEYVPVHVESLGRRQFRHRGKRQAQATCLRREYRMMTDDQRNRFHNAVQTLKQDESVEPNKYDAIALLHTGMAAFTAHGGAGFPGWHRIYILMFETALREVDNSVCLPYWDSSLDAELEDPTLSPVWSNLFLGTSQGAVTSGPFANWMTPEGGQLMRNVGTDGDPFTASAVEDILTRTSHADILTSAETEPRYDLEFHHAAVHVYVGGTMGQLDTAAFDPIFFLHHAFVDYLWELFRTNLRGMGIDPEVYPEIEDTGSRHHADSQTGFGNMTQADGYSDFLTQSYEYEAAPICSNQFPECGSIYLTCFTDIGRCVPIDPDLDPTPTDPTDNFQTSAPTTEQPMPSTFSPITPQPNHVDPITHQPQPTPGHQNPNQPQPNPVNPNNPFPSHGNLNNNFPNNGNPNNPFPNHGSLNNNFPNNGNPINPFPNNGISNNLFPNQPRHTTFRPRPVHQTNRPIELVPNRPNPGPSFPNTSPNVNPLIPVPEPTFPNAGVCSKVKNPKRYGNPVQNGYCCDKNCDTNQWATIPVKIVSVRPPKFSSYSSYPVRNGRVMTNSDIYSPSAYSKTNRYISSRMANPKTFKRCVGDEPVGQVFLTSKGINYDGYYKEAAIVDNRLAVSVSMGFVNIKKPTRGSMGVTKALLRAHDSCGRVCHAACKDPKTGEFKACSGAVAISNALPRMYGDTYDQAVMNIFDFEFNNDCPAFKSDNFFMTFYCDYHSSFPYAKSSHGGHHEHKPSVPKSPPVVIPQSRNGCQVSTECFIEQPCQCKGFSQAALCDGSCSRYGVCQYGRYFVKECEAGHRFDQNLNRCVPGFCRDHMSFQRNQAYNIHRVHSHSIPNTAHNSRVINSMSSNNNVIVNGNRIVISRAPINQGHIPSTGASYRQRMRTMNSYNSYRFRNPAKTNISTATQTQQSQNQGRETARPYYSRLMSGYLKQFGK